MPASRSASAPRAEATIGFPVASAADSVYDQVSGHCAGNIQTSGDSAAISFDRSASSYSPVNEIVPA